MTEDLKRRRWILAAITMEYSYIKDFKKVLHFGHETLTVKLPQQDDMSYQILHQLGRASKLLGYLMSKFLKFLASDLWMLFVIFCDLKDQLCIKFSLGKHELKKYKLQVLMA